MKNAFAKLTFVIIFAFAVTANAQNNCEISSTNAPLLQAFSGIWLRHFLIRKVLRDLTSHISLVELDLLKA